MFILAKESFESVENVVSQENCLWCWIQFLCLGLIAVNTQAVRANDGKNPSRPNVIFIMADDLGYTDLGCFGSRYYETPHIDQLARQGVRFLNHHHCQNCAPTRAAIMTGQYGPRTGVYTVGSIDRFDWQSRPLRPVENVEKLPLDRATIAEQVQRSGYQTGMFGKWHLGLNGAYHPSQRGFQEAVESSGQHFDFKTTPAQKDTEGKYLADYLTDRAVDFIERHQSAPFFLYVPHFGVHSPFQAKKAWIEKFENKPGVGGHKNPVYAAMIASVDESVGRILDKLDELKLADKTVVIFASDNGGVGGYEREGLHKANDVTDNAPLRSGKGSLYEGGTRVPLIVRWPGVAPAGAECRMPTIHVDLYPTFLEITSAERPEHPLDGESLLKLIKDPSAKLHREAIFQHFPGYLGSGQNQWRTTPVSLIQSGDWKLMEFLEDGKLELYNLASDVGEQKNLAATHPDKVNELQSRLKAWREEIKAPMPAKNASPSESNNGVRKGRASQKKSQKGKAKAAASSED